MSPSFIESIFATLYGVPSWQVRQGHGSFLTFEFGTPRQEIEPVINREPKRVGSRPTRMVTIRGDWHLWIYCCGWRIAQDGCVLATFESSRESIAAACGALNGQALSEFTFEPKHGESAFRFDLGGTLTTVPYNTDLLEQWMLYCPDGHVLIYRSDGILSHSSVKTEDRDGEFGKADPV